MPLMADWANVLCDELDAYEADLAAACHLRPGMDGPEFEESLGLLLRWDQFRDLEQRFEGLGGSPIGSVASKIRQARTAMADRMEAIKRIIDSTLFEQFGHSRIDDEKAAEAYGKLLEELGNPDLIVATTNYDRSVETALLQLGHEVITGFSEETIRTPILEPTGLVKNRGSKTPVIHLHGAVGWYDSDGTVKDHRPDQPFVSNLGTPVVLYPDPEKDPTHDALVSELWAEFRTALESADSILVVGHSLHDPALVDSLNNVKTGLQKPLVISYLDEEGGRRVERSIRGSIGIELEFGPELRTNYELRRAVEYGQRPAFLNLGTSGSKPRAGNSEPGPIADD
jgi:SIR2-like protein